MEDTKLKAKREKYGPKYFATVVRILSDTTIIIDAGSSDVHVGSLVQVYEYLGNLTDLDGNSLGSLEYVKAELEVVRTEPLYSICKTPKQNKSIVLSPLLEASYRPPFEVDKQSIEPIQATDSTVRVGDPVKHA